MVLTRARKAAAAAAEGGASPSAGGGGSGGSTVPATEGSDKTSQLAPQPSSRSRVPAPPKPRPASPPHNTGSGSSGSGGGLALPPRPKPLSKAHQNDPEHLPGFLTRLQAHLAAVEEAAAAAQASGSGSSAAKPRPAPSRPAPAGALRLPAPPAGGVGDRILGAASSAAASSSKRLRTSGVLPFTVKRGQAAPTLTMTHKQFEAVAWLQEQCEAVAEATSGLPDGEAQQERRRLLAKLTLGPNGPSAGSAEGWVRWAAAAVEKQCGARLPSQQAAAQPGGSASSRQLPKVIPYMLAECDKESVDLRSADPSAVPTKKVLEELFEASGLDFGDWYFKNLADVCVYEKGTTSCWTFHRPDDLDDRLSIRLFTDMFLDMVTNDVPFYDLLVAMGSKRLHHIDEDGSIRDPFCYLFRPGAPGYRVDHMAAHTRQGGLQTDKGIQALVGWLNAFGECYRFIFPKKPALDDLGTRVNRFLAGRGLQQLTGFQFVMVDTPACFCGATTYAGPASVKQNKLAQVKVGKAVYLMCFKHHSRLRNKLKRDEDLSRAEALEIVMTEKEEDFGRRGWSMPQGQKCEVCGVPAFSRLNFFACPHVWACKVCDMRLRRFVNRGEIPRPPA